MKTKVKTKTKDVFLFPSVEDLKKSLFEKSIVYFGISDNQGVDLVGVRISSFAGEKSVIRMEGYDEDTGAKITACYNMKRDKKPKGEIVFH